MPVFSDQSTEMQQMMGRIPGWVVRWGLWIIALIFIGIAVACYFIRYPQTITGAIELTAYNPPAELLTNRSGRVAHLFVRDGDPVDPGTNILVLESTADYNHVIKIDSILNSGNGWNEQVYNIELYQDYKLGDIQSYFLQLQKECAAFREYLSSPLNANKESLLKEQIRKQEELLEYQKQQLAISLTDLGLARKDFSRDSVIFSVEGIALADYERAKQLLLQKEGSVIGYRSSIGNTEASLLSMQSNLLENQTQNESQIKNYSIELDRLHRQLATQIETWKRDYLITAPVDGEVFLSNIWSVNQNVAASERIATVVPSENAVVMGRMAVPFSGYSKVEANQKVNIRLENYPYMEFGMVQGRVRSVSPIPDESGYLVEIDFPEGLTTSYGIPVSYVYKMTGTADIVTKDMRLIEQFIQPIKAVFDRL